MLARGQKVRVLAPFDTSFPGEHEIVAVVIHDDGQISYELTEIGHFAPQYVEVAG